MEVPLWLIILIVVIIIILIVIYIFYGQESSDIGVCDEEALMTEEEAWANHQSGRISENPFYLVAPNHNGPYGLALKSIPKDDTTCVGCGSKDIPFPNYCVLVDKRTGSEAEYTLEPGTADDVRVYRRGEEVINLGPNCQVSTLSNQIGYPVPKWTLNVTAV